MKADKGVAEIKFCNPVFACEEGGKACEESYKALCENTSKDFWKMIFSSLENSLLGYSRSLFSKGTLRGLMPISVFLKANVRRLWFYQKL